MGNTAQRCRLGLFQDSDFAGDLEDSNSTSEEGSYVSSEAEHLSPSVRCARNKRAFHHRSTESEIISLDAGLRMDGLLALHLWGHGNWPKETCAGQETIPSKKKNKTNTPTEKRKREIEELSTVDYVPTNTLSSQGESQLYIFEDNEAVIKMIIKGQSPTIGHVSRTHRVALDTNNQLADMLTKSSFTRDEWNHLLRLLNMMSFSMFSCSYFSNFLFDLIGKQSAM